MKNLKKGFTIIEMVIVIAIIGILAAVLIPTYGNVVANANQSAAQQTARSVMTNWLASSTSSAGVPTSGPDGYGNTLYAAYFEYKNSDTNQIYQYRYTSGGVELTNDDATAYVDWKHDPIQIAKSVYITTPVTDANFDQTTYAVNVYKVQKKAKQANGNVPAGGDYYAYYIEYPAGAVSATSDVKYAYDFGGATVYAATGEAMTFYQMTGAYTAGTAFEAVGTDGIVRATNGSVTFTPKTIETLPWTAQPAVGTTANTPSYDLELTVGATTGNTLTATIPTGAGAVSWSSDTTSVATVTGSDGTGTVSGVAAGTAKITCSWEASGTVEAGSQVFNVKINAA